MPGIKYAKTSNLLRESHGARLRAANMQENSSAESDDEDADMLAEEQHGAGGSLAIFQRLCTQLEECYYIRDTIRISLEMLCLCAGVGSGGQAPPAWQAWCIRVEGTETIGDILLCAERRYSRLFSAAAARGWVVEGLCPCESQGKLMLGIHSSIHAVACREPRHGRYYRRVKIALSHAALFWAFMLAQHARCGANSTANVLSDDVLRVLERVFRASYS